MKVTDEDGQLVAKAMYDGNAIFENGYTPKAGSVVLSAEKVLTGRTLQADEFIFELVDEDGTVLQTKANDATDKLPSMLLHMTRQANTVTPSVSKQEMMAPSLTMQKN